MKIVKIYGLRRTGTNYLQWLLTNNFDRLVVLTDFPKWKHGLPVDFTVNNVKSAIDKNLLTDRDYKLSSDLSVLPHFNHSYTQEAVRHILCVKDPYSWYLSICKWKNIEPFPLTKDKLEQFFLWNYMGREYRKFVCYPISSRVLIVRYEKLLSDLYHVLRSFEYVLDLECPKTDYYIDNEHNVYDDKPFGKRRHFYVSKKYLDFYSREDFDRIKDFLDKEVARDLGYKIH